MKELTEKNLLKAIKDIAAFQKQTGKRICEQPFKKINIPIGFSKLFNK